MGKPFEKENGRSGEDVSRLCAEVVKIEKARCVQDVTDPSPWRNNVKGEIKCPRCKTINRLDKMMRASRAAPKEK